MPLDQTYTDADVRTEAARQLRKLSADMTHQDVADEMQGRAIPSTQDGPGLAVLWHHDPDDFYDASHAAHDLIENATDTTAWAVHLGWCGLRGTTELAWGHGDAWDLAVQVALRPGVAPELHEAIVSAVRDAVTATLAVRGLRPPLATPPEGLVTGRPIGPAVAPDPDTGAPW